MESPVNHKNQHVCVCVECVCVCVCVILVEYITEYSNVMLGNGDLGQSFSSEMKYHVINYLNQWESAQVKGEAN